MVGVVVGVTVVTVELVQLMTVAVDVPVQLSECVGKLVAMVTPMKVSVKASVDVEVGKLESNEEGLDAFTLTETGAL